VIAGMSIVYFTLVAIVLYLAADWLLNRAEIAAGRRFAHRSLIFFAILLSLALTSFTLIQHYTGGT
jgi:Ca2+/Na+ antiporter